MVRAGGRGKAPKLSPRRWFVGWFVGSAAAAPPIMPRLRVSLSTCRVLSPHLTPPPEHHTFPQSQRTSIRAEAVFLVLVKVGGGRAPAVAVRAPIGGAALVGFAVEDKGENALVPVAVPVVGEED